MKIHRSTGYIHIDLSGAEAAVLLEELETVPGGSRLPKLRQVCDGLRASLAFEVAMAPSKYASKKYQRKVILRAVEDPDRSTQTALDPNQIGNAEDFRRTCQENED